MTLRIDIPDDLEQSLRQQALQAGVSLEAFVREALQERVGDVPDPIAEAYARLPRGTPEDIAELARQQGVTPRPFRALLGSGPGDEDDFDVDAFLAARREWQREERAFDADFPHEP